MKKGFLITALSIGLMAVSGISLSITKNASVARADEKQINYIDIGPGVFNHHNSTDESLINTKMYSLAYRAKYLGIFMNSDMYQDIDYHTYVSSYDQEDTDYSLIRIYTGKKTFKTMKEILADTNAQPEFNVWGDVCLNLGLPVLKYSASDIYMVTIAEGFVYPYAPDASHDVQYVQTRSIAYINTKYGTGTEDVFYSGEWSTSKELSGGREEISIAACSSDRGNMNYRVHIRGDLNPYDSDEEDDSGLYDNGSCYLLIFFDDENYNPEINGVTNVSISSDFFDVSENEDSFLNRLYRKVTFKTPEGETLTLEDVSNPKTKGLPYYNLWGERGCVCFKIGNMDESKGKGNYLDDLSYCATSFASITIERGAEFPAYATTNGDSIKDIRYVASDTVTLNLENSNGPYWVTYAPYIFSYGDTRVTSLSASTENFTCGSETVSGTFVHVTLDNDNYVGLENAPVGTLTSDVTRYVYVNGRSLYYLNEKNRAFVNVNGRTDTISFLIENLAPTDITEIIVQKGCSVPSASNSTEEENPYGQTPYFNVLKTNSFERSSGTAEFTKSSSLTWTLWFDGANPIRVGNSKYFDMDQAPVPEKEGYSFNYWEDKDGNKVYGNIQVYSGMEFSGNYTALHTVKLINGKSVTEIKIEHFKRLTCDESVKANLYPTKKGYQFLGWFDENDEIFNIDNRIVSDLVLTARYAKDGSSSAGCSGSVTATSTLLAVLSLAGVSLTLKKRRG